MTEIPKSIHSWWRRATPVANAPSASDSLLEKKPTPLPTQNTSLAHAAKSAVMWGGGFTMARDVIQFANMLVMVRLLAPEDYGAVALAQSIIGLLSVFSFASFVSHALQMRDPADVDWQAHFTAAAAINVVVLLISLAVATVLYHTERFAQAALPLAGLSLIFLIEIPSTLRDKMLLTQHNWSRNALLPIIGTLLGCGVGIAIAMLGGGYWALVVPALLFSVPAAIDLLFIVKWRPDWSWSWPRYQETAKFGVTLMGSAGLWRTRLTTEQHLLAGAYDMATLGIYSRSVGLATLLAGRVGTIITGSLFPVLTRAERGSIQFRRYAGLVLRGVSWVTIPAAAFLAVAASDVVGLLYGDKWSSVIPLIPFAVAGVALIGISSASTSMILANSDVRLCLLLDFISAVVGIILAFWLIPLGVATYLAGLVGHGALVMTASLFLLWMRGGISLQSIIDAFVPAIVAAAAGLMALFMARMAFDSMAPLLLRIVVEGAAMGVVYVITLRLLFAPPLRELVNVVPGSKRLSRMFFPETSVA